MREGQIPRDRTVTVTLHAVLQHRQRFQDARPNDVISTEIELSVREAANGGRMRNNKPNGFRLYGEKGRQLPIGQRCAWNEDMTRAWIVVREDNEDVIVTSLSPTGVCKRIAS